MLPHQTGAQDRAGVRATYLDDFRYAQYGSTVEIHRSRGAPLNDYNVDLQIKEFFSWDVWCCNFENTARNINSSTALESYGPLLSSAPSLAIIRAVLAMIHCVSYTLYIYISKYLI